MNYSPERLEAQRKAALEGRNAVKYFTLCNELGIGEHSVEDFDLYERGQVDESASFGSAVFFEFSGRDSDKPLRNSGPDYSGFLREHRDRGVPEALDKWADTKKAALVKFSARFRKGGSNDLETRDYAPAEIGAMYRGILRQALKKETKVKR